MATSLLLVSWVVLCSFALINGQDCDLPSSRIGDKQFIIHNSLSNDGRVRTGSFASLQCKQGETVQGGAATSRCVRGQWKLQFGSCTPAVNETVSNKCLSKVTLLNGILVATGKQNEYKLECESGFELMGSAYIYCLPPGEVTRPGYCKRQTKLTPKKMQAPKFLPTAKACKMCYSSAVANGIVVTSGWATSEGSGRYGHVPGTTITVTCNEGYMLVGQPYAVCRNDGYWSATVGYCLRAATTTTTKPTVTLATKRSCATTTTTMAPANTVSPPPWNTDDFTDGNCYLPQIPFGTVILSKPNRLRSATMHRIVPNTLVTIRCFDGYRVAYGAGAAICRDNGAFSATLGDCVPVTTPAPQPQPRTVVIYIDDNVSGVKPFVKSVPSSSRLLVDAARYRKVADLRSLLSKGGDVNAADSDGTTLLMWAAQNGDISSLQILLVNGADINATTTSGGTALHFAAARGQDEVVGMLLARRADPNVKDDAGLTPLLIAAANGYAGIVARLLNNGADVGARDASLATALIIAAYKGNADVVDVLLHRGADPNAFDDSQQTALMVAAKQGFNRVVSTLVNNLRVDKYMADVNGRTAEQLARISGFQVTAELIRSVN